MKRMRRTRVIGTTIAVVAIGSVMALGAGQGWWKPCVAEPEQQASLLPIEVQEAALEALVGAEGEYAAYATYDAIINEYGNVNPYANIMAAEAKHIDALKRILDQYEVAYPAENPYLGMIEVPESLSVAAQAGVDAEIANVALYAEQLDAVENYPDIVAVFLNLQAASLEQHLPAFQRAVARQG
jgi:hypothetical protein